MVDVAKGGEVVLRRRVDLPFLCFVFALTSSDGREELKIASDYRNRGEESTFCFLRRRMEYQGLWMGRYQLQSVVRSGREGRL